MIIFRMKCCDEPEEYAMPNVLCPMDLVFTYCDEAGDYACLMR